jgi:hypothetical protein
MKQVSYKSSWQASIDESLSHKKNQWGMVAGYPGVMKQVEEKGGRFVAWHLSTMPALGVEMDLDSAINIACIYPTHPYAQTFLSWANEAADRALSDIRFTYDPDEERAKGNLDPLVNRGWKIPGIFPGNHGSTLAAACFARAMRDNSALDEKSLLLAADEIAQSALDTTSQEWSEIPQSDYLRCIRLALIAGRVDRAQAFFKNCRRKFKFTQEHHTWLQNLCKGIEAAQGAAGGILDAAAVEAFQNFFDQVRNPAIRSVGEAKSGNAVCTNISLLRLELALIKQRYVLQLPYAGNWTDILGFISE